ncbi:AraC family transcriptional regulator [Phragmitibacter flavus]|nr:AraC family transcriptional regulator [Phragmitibacter flavus]
MANSILTAPIPASAATAKNPSNRAFQNAFFRRMGDTQQFRLLFDHLPDIGFFAKDAEGRFVAFTPHLQRLSGCTTEEEYLGRDDSIMHTPLTTATIRQDDLKVMRTGQPLINRVEFLFNSGPGSGWYCTTKLPIFDSEKHIIGLMGVVKPFTGALGTLPEYANLEAALRLIETHYAESIPTDKLASATGCSARQLNRRFQKAFNMSLQDFIAHRRIQAAMEALHGSATLADIASQHGFSDQSHLTRQMRKLTGMTPGQVRRRLATPG